MVGSLSAMQKMAQFVAGKLYGGEILLLSGELGSGKTTFTQGLAQALGVTTQVTSPTFTIVSEYDVAPKASSQSGIKKLIHVDLYRLASSVAADPAVQQVLHKESKEHVTIVEWADKLAAAPAGGIKISFQHGSQDQERLVMIDGLDSDEKRHGKK